MFTTQTLHHMISMTSRSISDARSCLSEIERAGDRIFDEPHLVHRAAELRRILVVGERRLGWLRRELGMS